MDIPISDHGSTALCFAAYTGSLELVQCLVKAGADVSKPERIRPDADYNGSGTTALWHAIMGGHIAMVKFLVSCGADINKMSAAACSGGLAMLRFVTAVGVAGMWEHKHILNFLVHWVFETRGTLQQDFGLTDFGLTALNTAIVCGDLELVNWLWNSDLRVSITPAFLAPLLDNATREGRFQIVQLLLEHGAEANARDFLGMAIHLGHFQVVQILLQHGAYVNAYDIHHGYRMALPTAITRGHTDIMRILLDFGVDMEKQGPPAMVAAIEVASSKLLRLVIGTWASTGNVDMASAAVGRCGGIPLILAAKCADVEVTHILLEHKVHRADDASRALRAAIHHSNLEVARLLLA